MKLGIPPGEMPESSYDIAVVHKALDVLEILAFARRALTLHELTQRSGLPKPTTFRLLQNLVTRGYAVAEHDGSYRLGQRGRVLAGVNDERLPLRAIALPVMRDLRDRHGHTVSLAIRLKNRILYVDSVEGTHALRFVEPPGSTGPLHATALGKALLASASDIVRNRVIESIAFEVMTPSTIADAQRFRSELATVRTRGYAVDDEESVPGARCVAAPILIDGGEAIAAISISAPGASLEGSTIEAVANDIQAACRLVAKRLKEEKTMH